MVEYLNISCVVCQVDERTFHESLIALSEHEKMHHLDERIREVYWHVLTELCDLTHVSQYRQWYQCGSLAYPLN